MRPPRFIEVSFEGTATMLNIDHILRIEQAHDDIAVVWFALPSGDADRLVLETPGYAYLSEDLGLVYDFDFEDEEEALAVLGPREVPR